MCFKVGLEYILSFAFLDNCKEKIFQTFKFIQSRISEYSFLKLTLYLLTFLVSLFIVIFFTNPTFFSRFNIYSHVQFLKLDSDLSEIIPIENMLIVIVTVLATIMAIVFTFNLSTIERLAEKYTPYVVEMYNKNMGTKKTIYYFYIVIVCSFLMIFVYKIISKQLLLLFTVLIAFGFVLCMVRLINYHLHVTDLMNPFIIATGLKKQTIEYIENGNGEANKLITNMGDIVIKSIDKNEKAIAKTYLDTIYDIFHTSIGKHKQMDYLNSIFEAYNSVLSFCIPLSIELKYIILSDYQKISSTFCNTKFQNKFDRAVFDSYNGFLKDVMYFGYKQVLQADDFDLFEYGIDIISKSSIDDPKEDLKDIRSDLMDIYTMSEDDKISSNLKLLDNQLDELPIKFSNHSPYEEIIKKINENHHLISEDSSLIDKDQIFQTEEKCINDLFNFYVDSSINKIFFLIGSDCLLLDEKKKINSEEYIGEMWFHTETLDPLSISANKVPVTSDIEFLFNILFFGGEGNTRWYSKYFFTSFKSQRKYLYKYFLLRLTYLLNRNGKLCLDINKSSSEHKLRYGYVFIQKYMFAVDELVQLCNILICEHDKWGKLLQLPPIENDIDLDSEMETKNIVLTTKDQFRATLAWLNINKKDFELKLKQIESYLPIDKDKLDKCKKSILNSYDQNDIIRKISSVPSTSNKFTNFQSNEITLPLEKNFFLDISAVDCSQIWHEVGKRISAQESNYFVNEILNHEEIERIKLGSTDNFSEVYLTLLNELDMMVNDGIIPTTILMPNELHNKFLIDRPDGLSRKFLKHNRISNEIIHSPKREQYYYIFMYPRDVCMCTYSLTNDDKEQLIIKIDENPNCDWKVELFVQSKMILSISDYKKIKIMIIDKGHICY